MVVPGEGRKAVVVVAAGQAQKKGVRKKGDGCAIVGADGDGPGVLGEVESGPAPQALPHES